MLPQSLEDFNKLPKVTPWFFMNELRLKRLYESPVSFKHQTEVEIFCQGPIMRFKYKFYAVSEVGFSYQRILPKGKEVAKRMRILMLILC